MSLENTTGHILKYKDDDGIWHDIPIIYQTMYQAYVAYCESYNTEYPGSPITIITQAQYYTMLGSLQTIAEALDINNDVIPLSAGGTGVTASSNSDLLTQLGAAASTALTALTQTVTNLSTTVTTHGTKLDKLTEVAVYSGTSTPVNSLGKDGDVYIKYN